MQDIPKAFQTPPIGRSFTALKTLRLQEPKPAVLPASSNPLHRRCVYASKVGESQSQILRSSMGGLSLSTHSSHEGSMALTQSGQSLARENNPTESVVTEVLDSHIETSTPVDVFYAKS